MRKVCRFLFYLFGMIVLALGLTLSTKVNLGVSPIISVAFAWSVITGFSIGDTTLVLYLALIVIQIILHVSMATGRFRKKQKQGENPAAISDPESGSGVEAPGNQSLRRNIIMDLLQLPLSLVFTRVMNVFSLLIPVISGRIVLQIVLMLLAIVLVGIGAAITLDMRLILNPGDGIVRAISDRTGMSLGLSKNCVDIGCVCITAVSTLLLTHSIVGIGIGTLMAMVGTGRVIAVFNKVFDRQISWFLKSG